MIRRVRGHFGTALALALIALATAASATTTRAFDPQHSSAGFSVRVLWLHAVRGSIGAVHGTLHLDPTGRATVAATIDVALVRMDDPRYLATVRSEDFFDSATFPEMTFRSAAFDPALLTRGGVIAGWLTLRGVTLPVTFELLPDRCAAPAFEPCRIRVCGSVRRSDFGMRSHRFSVSDIVQLRLGVELAAASVP